LRTYELVTILSPMLNQEQAAEAWGRIKEFITVRQAEITREQSWGTRRLAYPIRKGSINFLEGSYYLTQFATERPFNFDLEVFLHRDERVLRSLVTVADPDAPLAQPGMAAAAAAAARAAAEAAAAAAEAAAAAAAAAAGDSAGEVAAGEVAAGEVAVGEAAERDGPAVEEAGAEPETGEAPVAGAVAGPDTADEPEMESVKEQATEPAMGSETADEPESPELEARADSSRSDT
jgi:ribosomal protein S6